VISALPPPPPRPPGSWPTVPTSSRRIHPGVFIGSGIVVLGIVAAVVWFASQVPGISDDIDQLARGSTAVPLEFDTEETLDWTLFIEPAGASLSGVRFTIVDSSTGEPLELLGAGNFSYSWFGRSGRAIGRVQIPPGSYLLRVEGDATIAIGPNLSGRIWRAFGGAALLGIPLVLGGLATALVSAVRDTRRRTTDAEPPPPSPWSSGEWPVDPGR